jgi:hypothetical protein
LVLLDILRQWSLQTHFASEDQILDYLHILKHKGQSMELLNKFFKLVE